MSQAFLLGARRALLPASPLLGSAPRPAPPSPATRVPPSRGSAEGRWPLASGAPFCAARWQLPCGPLDPFDGQGRASRQMLLLFAVNGRRELISRQGALAIRRYLEGSSPAQFKKNQN